VGISGMRELRQLREENSRLKRLVADLTLDKHILGEVIRKKCMTRPAFARTSSEGVARRSAKMYPAY
jgi:hypothetical protein